MYFFVSNCDQNFVEKDESEHFWSCRVQIGKIYKICDQSGTFATIKITKIDRKPTKIEFEILEKNYISLENWLKNNEKNVKVLFQAQIDKNYLEKWAEILPFGFWKQVFIFASEFSPKQSVNLDRLNRILTRSTEQSENLYKPKIEIIDKKKLFEIMQQNKSQNSTQNEKLNLSNDKNSTQIEKNSQIESKFIVLDIPVQPNLPKFVENTKEINNVKNIYQTDCEVSNFVIGAEGGFSDYEKQTFADFGCQFQSFGQIIYPSWLATFLVL